MQVSIYNQRVFQLVVENVEDYAVFVVDLDGRIVSWNPGVENLLGYKEDEFVGEKGAVIFTPEDRAAGAPEWELETALQTGKCEDVRWHVRRDGSRFWANGLMMLLKDETGEIKGFVKIMRDQTAAKIAEERLRESEERLSRMTEIGTVGIIFFQASGVITRANDAFFQMSGYTPEDIAQGLVRWDIQTPPEFMPQSHKAIDDLVNLGQTAPYEKQYIRKDGSRWWGLFAAKRISETEGVEFVIDITTMKEAVSALRESEERYRSLFDSIDDGFCVVEMLFDENGKPADYRFLEVNHTFEEQTGLVNAQNRTARELVPELEEKWIETYGRVALTGEAVRFENFSDAMNRCFDVYAFRFGKTEKNQVAIVFRDITVRKRAEQERERLLKQIEAERAKLVYLFEQAPAVVAVLRGRDLVFEFANPAYLRLMRQRDVLGKPIREALPELEGQGFFELLDDVFATGEPYIGREIPIHLQLDPEGPLAETFFDFVYQPIFDAERNVTGIFAHGVEITEQVAARRQAESANRLKDDFLATVSHELRTPLNAILGWAKMLQSGVLDKSAHERAVQTIVRSAESQARLIEDLLDVSRIMSGKLRLNLRPVEIVQVVEAAIETIIPAAQIKEIRLETFIDTKVPIITGDAERLQQVFWNLLTNAVKFTPRGGSIRVHVGQEGSYLNFSIEDTGAGIGAEFLPFVFDRFRQADAATTRSAGGMGLGLAIVKNLVEMHGGSVRAESAGEGKGATFTAAFPVRARRKDEIAKGEGTTESSASGWRESIAIKPDPALDGVKIVFVDDVEDARLLVKELLSLSGADVTVCASAQGALEAIVNDRPDLIISDIGMPDEDGYSLIQKIRSLPPQRGGRIPAIALTAYTRVEDRVKALSAGYQMFIPKPIDPGELIAAAASLARLAAGSA